MRDSDPKGVFLAEPSRFILQIYWIKLVKSLVARVVYRKGNGVPPLVRGTERASRFIVLKFLGPFCLARKVLQSPDCARPQMRHFFQGSFTTCWITGSISLNIYVWKILNSAPTSAAHQRQQFSLVRALFTCFTLPRRLNRRQMPLLLKKMKVCPFSLMLSVYFC